MSLLEDLQKNPLYDTALIEVVESFPAGIKETDLIPFSVAREMMIVCWIRGASWHQEWLERKDG